jgi:hypothetical protein
MAALADHFRRSRSRGDSQQRESVYVECKAERLLLIDVTSD